MNIFTNVVCPISSNRVDSNVSRLTAFLIVILLAVYLFTGFQTIIALIAIDYLIRAAFSPKYSPMKWLAELISRLIKIPIKMVDAAPKLFASRIGVLFAVTALLLSQTYVFASATVATILLVFAFLDSVFDFCFGCLAYHYIVFPLFGKNQK